MASSAAAIASVAQHVTVTSVSGSTLRPYHSPYFATRASRSRFAPQVMAYWFTSSDRAGGRLLQHLRRGKVGEPLGEVDRAVLVREPGHPADHGFGEAVGAGRGVHGDNINPGFVARLDLAGAVPR